MRPIKVDDGLSFAGLCAACGLDETITAPKARAANRVSGESLQTWEEKAVSAAMTGKRRTRKEKPLIRNYNAGNTDSAAPEHTYIPHTQPRDLGPLFGGTP